MRRRWDVHKVAIGHRVGTVGVGEPSVIIAVSSAHRRASLEVTRGKDCVVSACAGGTAKFLGRCARTDGQMVNHVRIYRSGARTDGWSSGSIDMV